MTAIVTVVGLVGPVVMCHSSRTVINTCEKVRLHFTRELTKE